MTFGESPALTRDMGRAYIDGFQTSYGKDEIKDGWGYKSVNAMVKHWPSGGAEEGGRDGHTIDPAMIERIEVIHGANALQGLGASGGIINIITKRAPRTDGERFHEVMLGASGAMRPLRAPRRPATSARMEEGKVAAWATVSASTRSMWRTTSGNAAA